MEFSRPEYWSWVAFPFSRGSSQPRDWTKVSLTAGGFFISWARRDAQEYWSGSLSLLQQIFLTQELNWGLLHCRQTLYQLNYQGNTNNILSEKELHFQKKKLVRRIGLFYIFENLFKLWLKEASWILISGHNLLRCHTSCGIWKTSLCTCERVRVKKANNNIITKIGLPWGLRW